MQGVVMMKLNKEIVVPVLKKNGFKFEGVLCKNANNKGKILDEYVFAKLKK